MSDHTRNDNPNDQRPATPGPFSNWERETLERLVFATVREQRASRRWGIFFKLSFLLLAFFSIWAYFDFNFGTSDIESLGRHTALIEIDGSIDTEGSGAADTVIPSLNKAFSDPGC
jgi:protease-4